MGTMRAVVDDTATHQLTLEDVPPPLRPADRSTTKDTRPAVVQLKLALSPAEIRER